jgi:flagellin-like protein
MKFNKNDEAVSPVIGVILMVAITVILAAVIAAFVFGMAGGISKTKTVAATASKTVSPGGTPTVSVTYQGGQDATSVALVEWRLNDISMASEANPLVGWSDSSTAGHVDQKDHVVVMARFTDQSSQVILDTWV